MLQFFRQIGAEAAQVISTKLKSSFKGFFIQINSIMSLEHQRYVFLALNIFSCEHHSIAKKRNPDYVNCSRIEMFKHK